MKSEACWGMIGNNARMIADDEKTVGELYERKAIARQYIEKRKKFSWQRVLHREQVAAINRCIERFRPASVLEVAPGPARLAFDLEGVESGMMIENSREMISIAEERLAARGLSGVWRLVQGNAFELDKVVREEFDLAFSFRFIRHFKAEDRGRLYRLIRGRLRSKGILMFDVVNKPVRSKLDFRQIDNSGDEIRIHDETYTAREFQNEMERNGFEVLTLEPVLRHFWLQSVISYKFDDFASRMSFKVVEGLEKIPSRNPLEWVAVCRKA